MEKRQRTVTENFDRFSYLEPEVSNIQNEYSGLSDDLPTHLDKHPVEIMTVYEADEKEFQDILEYLEGEYPLNKKERFAFGIQRYREYRAYFEMSEEFPEPSMEELVKDIYESR